MFIRALCQTGVIAAVLLSGWACHRLKPLATDTPSPKGDALSSTAARESKENAEILAEMYRVIFLRPAENRVEFGMYVASLNEGTSLDGVHNGFTHSVAYQALERQAPKPTPAAYAYFLSEFRIAYGELASPPELTPDLAKAFDLTVERAYRDVSQDEIHFGRPKASDSKKLSTEAVEKKAKTLFSGSSSYTLKRLLTEMILEVIDEKSKEGTEALAEWYAGFVLRAVAAGRDMKVDFGLPLRNLPDRAFHKNWALKARPQRLRWEVLNRVHRILNPLPSRPANS